MIPLMFAALAGGILTAAMTAPFGIIASVVSAPFGGSLCAVLAAIHLARRRGGDWQSRDDIEAQTDAMVAALKDMAERGRTSEGTVEEERKHGTDAAKAA